MSSNENIKKCENKFCKEYCKELIQKTKDMITYLTSEYKNQNKKKN